ncbi:hypothetical protein EJ02DRAFT_459354 [Clathrospora elynae]|uniref:Uncharacterized protein n=1 Tax=Clathrospora elynae TaxID=706981 RepID=A0A6A5SGZ5_9PLEO|nr:hypothetical protein EJ02DRAFT_459354 [Clathrospora elynae]
MLAALFAVLLCLGRRRLVGWIRIATGSCVYCMGLLYGSRGRSSNARPSFTSLSQIWVCKAMLAASFARVVSRTATVGGFVGVEVERRQCQAVLHLSLPDLDLSPCWLPCLHVLCLGQQRLVGWI